MPCSYHSLIFVYGVTIHGYIFNWSTLNAGLVLNSVNISASTSAIRPSYPGGAGKSNIKCASTLNPLSFNILIAFSVCFL